MKPVKALVIAIGIAVLTSCVAQPQTDRSRLTAHQTGSTDTAAAFLHAAQDDDAQGVKTLLANGLNVNARFSVSWGPLHPSPYAAWTPLHVAAYFNAKDVAALLLERGADVNAKALGGETPLHFAANGQDTSVAALLLEHGANPNAKDDDGNTPLMKAALGSQKEMVQLLVTGGADVNASNNDGETPLLSATRMSTIDGYDLVTFLLDKGANANAPDSRGDTPLATAIKRGDNTLATLLRSHGAKLSDVPTYADLEDAQQNNDVVKLKELLAELPDNTPVNWVNRNGAGLLSGAVEQNQADIVKLLLEKGVAVEGRDQQGRTPLLNAAMEGDKEKEIAAMLLEHGADVNARDNDKSTPLLLAAANPPNKEMAEMLLEHGADVNAQDRIGDTPLTSAVRDHISADMVELLLRYNADVNLRDGDGNTPLHLAEAYDPGVSDVLRQHGGHE